MTSPRLNTGLIPSRPSLFVGRDQERVALASVLENQHVGAGRLVAIEGAPGIGKTSLLADHASTSANSGVAVVWSRCTELDRIRPFGGLVDALDCRLQHPDPSRRRVAEVMVSSADAIADPFRFETDQAWRIPVQESIVDLVLESLDSGPLLLVIDDVQWADAGTLGVMLALGRRCSSMPLVLAWTRRLSYSVAVVDQLTDRHREYVLPIVLGPLRTNESFELGCALAGGQFDDELATRLGRAGGNPFFISAVAGGTSGDAGANTASDAVLSWVARMPKATADLLGVAAVLGMAFSSSVLAAMTDHSPSELLELLDPAVHADLVQITGSGGYRFGHDLIRSALEGDLPASLVRALHRDAARVLRGAEVDPGVIARHLAHGARPGDEEAAEEIRCACERVIRHDARTAAEFLGRAVELCTSGSATWAATVADQVLALQWSGQPAAALRLANEAITQPMPKSEMARIRLVRATSLGLVNDLPASAEEYRVLAYDEDVDPALRAMILSELSTLDAWGLDRANGKAHAEEALALARSSGKRQAELQALCALSTMAVFDGRVAEGIQIARDAVTLGRDHRSLAPARELYLGLALAINDEYAEADLWLRSGQAAADKVSDLWLVSRYQLARMAISLLSGEWDAAQADAEAVITLHADTGMATGLPQAPAIAAMISLFRGAPDVEVDRYRALATASAASGAEPIGLLYFAWLEALMAQRDGRLPDAVATMRYIFESVGSTAHLVQTWLAPDFVRILCAAGEFDEALAVATEVAEFSTGVGSGSAIGTGQFCLGSVALARGDTTTGIAALQRASDVLRGTGRRPLLVRSLELLEAAGPAPSTAEELAKLRLALGIAGADVAAKGFALPTSASGPPTGAADSQPDPAGRLAALGLTATERSVAELVTEGLTNPLIALRLGVSKRTVEFHVANIYVKVGVSGRVALATLLRT